MKNNTKYAKHKISEKEKVIKLLYPKESINREVKSLDGFWTFCEDREDIGEKNKWNLGVFNEKARQSSVPASYNELFNDLFNFHGKVWYSKEFYVPISYVDKAIYLRFGNVAGKAKVWVNGIFVGEHIGTALPFEFEISNIAKFAQKNTVVVLADSTLDAYSLPPAAISITEGSVGFTNSYPRVPYDFFPYGGIQRSVFLYTCPKTRIEDITVTTDILETEAKVNFEVEFSSEVNGEIVFETDGKETTVSVEGKKVNCEVTIENPRLWDVGKPELYTVEITLKNENGEIDNYTQTYGIREVKVVGDKFLLNGKPVFFNGFGKHEDFFIYGKGFLSAVTVKDFELLNWVGANSFRTSHYPYDENIMDFADQHGILVIDETPFVGLCKRMYRDDILIKAKSVIEELVKRDKNHPSVVMWSLANEPYIESVEGKEFFKELLNTTRKLDSTRPITYVSHLGPENNLGYENFDVVCINRYWGWYDGNGRIEEILPDFNNWIETHRKAFGKPIIVSEFGADAIEGMHTDPPQMFTEEYQAKLIKMQYNELRKKDYVIGAHVWCFADFKSTQNPCRIVLSRKGVFTRDRQPKMSAYMLKDLWGNEDKL